MGGKEDIVAEKPSLCFDGWLSDVLFSCDASLYGVQTAVVLCNPNRAAADHLMEYISLVQVDVMS